MSSKFFILFLNGEFEFFLHDISDLCLTGSHWLLSGVSVNRGDCKCRTITICSFS